MAVVAVLSSVTTGVASGTAGPGTAQEENEAIPENILHISCS